MRAQADVRGPTTGASYLVVRADWKNYGNGDGDPKSGDPRSRPHCATPPGMCPATCPATCPPPHNTHHELPQRHSICMEAARETVSGDFIGSF